MPPPTLPPQYTHKELKQRKDEYREEVNNLLDALKDSQKELDSILLARDRLRSLYDSHFNHIQTVSNALHTIYFEANKKNRTSAAPKRFNNLPKISKPPLVAPEFTKRDLRTIQKKLSEVTTILKNGEQQIQKEFLDGIEKFNKLDKLDWQGWQEEEKRRR